MGYNGKEAKADARVPNVNQGAWMDVAARDVSQQPGQGAEN